jgi:hypothetical protein
LSFNIFSAVGVSRLGALAAFVSPIFRQPCRRKGLFCGNLDHLDERQPNKYAKYHLSINDIGVFP